MKKSLLLGSVVAATIVFTGCSGQMAQMMNSGMGQQVAQNAVKSNASDTTKKVASQATAKGNCIPRMSGGQTGMLEMFKEKAITYAIDEAIKSIEGLEDIKYPSKLTDTCQADKALKYVESISTRYFENYNLVSKKILDSMEQTEKVKKLQAKLHDYNNIKDKAEISEGAIEINEELQELMKTHKSRDSKKVSEAYGIFFNNLTKYTAVLVGWDKEIAEFSKDNLPWAIKNFDGVKTALVQLKAVGMAFVNTKDGLTNFIQTNDIKVNKSVAKRAAKKQEIGDKKVIQQNLNAFS